MLLAAHPKKPTSGKELVLRHASIMVTPSTAQPEVGVDEDNTPEVVRIATFAVTSFSTTHDQTGWRDIDDGRVAELYDDFL